MESTKAEISLQCPYCKAWRVGRESLKQHILVRHSAELENEIETEEKGVEDAKS